MHFMQKTLTDMIQKQIQGKQRKTKKREGKIIHKRTTISPRFANGKHLVWGGTFSYSQGYPNHHHEGTSGARFLCSGCFVAV